MAKVGLFVWTFALLAGSLHFALTRSLQVDELQNLYMARILARGELHQAVADPAIWLYGPLGLLTKLFYSTRPILLGGRLVFWLVFWTNLALLSAAVSAGRGRKEHFVWLLLAATLSPLWDYGMEIRHDNLLLSALLLVAFLARRARSATSAWLVLGGLVPLLQLVAYKSFAYLWPLLFLLLVFPSPSLGLSWEKRTKLFLLGLLGAGVLLGSIYWITGDLAIVLHHGQILTSISQQKASFSPRKFLLSLPDAVPLLLLVTLLIPVVIGLCAYKSKQRLRAWDGPWPEGAFLLHTLLALWANPTPFPYNLIFVVAGAALFAGRGLVCLEDDQMSYASAVPGELRKFVLALPNLAVLCMAHLLPFAERIARHREYGMDQQLRMIAYAEALTGNDDPVYDAVGLVVSRRTVGPLWYLHSLLLDRMPPAGRSWVTRQLEKDPAPVLLLNYRWSWLPEPDWRWIEAHYVAPSPFVRLLGAVLPTGGGDLQVLRPGRYEMVGGPGVDISSCQIETTSGQALPRGHEPNVLELHSGVIHIHCDPGVGPQVRWLGPRLERSPDVPTVNHRTWFVNWY